MKTQQKRRRPVATFRTGCVETRIWAQDGRNGDLWRVDQVCTSRRGPDGKLVKSFGMSDLEDAARGARLAQQWFLRQGRRRGRLFRWFFR